MQKPKTVMIIGASGYVGYHLALGLRKRFKVVATYKSREVEIPGATCIQAQIEDAPWLKRIGYTFDPDIVIYVAGSNVIPITEDEQKVSERQHTGGVVQVFDSFGLTASKFIYLSNSYIFDGIEGNYRENDAILPGNILGKNKAGSENFVRSRSGNYIIIRSAPLIGRGNPWHPSFLDQLHSKLETGTRVELSNNELQSYVSIYQLLEVVEKVIDTNIRNKILHLGGLTKVTPYRFGQLFAETFGYDPRLIDPLPPDGPRQDFSLNCTQLIQTLKIQPLLLEESFDLLKKNLLIRS